MKRTTLLTVLSFFVYCSQAQNDSTRLDAGGVVLQRPFTQNVSIKGEDLEKMPFASLTEALNVWLSGSYTDASYVTFVVDGNILSDVNSYSIHDIEEVVLVQNAAALTGLGGGQPQMVVITTRKGKGRSGIQGAAQVFLVHNPNAAVNLYHQYYLGAYRNLDKVSFGLSANFLRDTDPMAEANGLHVSSPFHMDRWRLNGYFSWRPDRKNDIEVHAGFTPQTIGAQYDYPVPNNGSFHYSNEYAEHGHTNLFLPWMRWRGEWARGLRNDLQAGLASELQKVNNWQLSTPDDISQDRFYSELHGTQHTDHVYIRDRLSYQMQAGSWSVEPSVNASYQHFRNGYSNITYSATGPNAVPGGSNPGMIATMGSSGGVYATLYILTPSIDISYKQGLDIQGGFTANISHVQGSPQGLKRVFPFASATVDVLGFSNKREHSSLQLFGSYAQRDGFIYQDYNLKDLSSADLGFLGLSGGAVWNGGGLPAMFPATNKIKYFWVWQTGASFTSKDKRWQLSYHFERLNFGTLGYMPGPYYPPNPAVVVVYPEWKSSRHFFRVLGRIVDNGSFSWQTGLTATVIRNKTDMYPNTYLNEPLGEHAKGNDKPSWTGGWTHRLRYKELSAGIDLLYHFNREVITYTPTGAETYFRTNTFLLQNIYIAYQLHLPGKKGLEVYVDSRGLVRNDRYELLDSRRYYGIGGKITM